MRNRIKSCFSPFVPCKMIIFLKQRPLGLYKQFISPEIFANCYNWTIIFLKTTCSLHFKEHWTEEGMVHLRICSTKYNLFYTLTKDSCILECCHVEDGDDDTCGDSAQPGCWEGGQCGQGYGGDSVLAPWNKMTVR